MELTVDLINKVSWDGKKIVLSFEGDKGEAVSYTDRINPPTEAFMDAFADLTKHALAVAGISLRKGSKVEARHLTLTHKEDANNDFYWEAQLGVVVLPEGGGSVSVTSPPRSMDALPRSAVAQIDLVVELAKRYLAGERQTLDLFLADAETSPREEEPAEA